MASHRGSTSYQRTASSPRKASIPDLTPKKVQFQSAAEQRLDEMVFSEAQRRRSYAKPAQERNTAYRHSTGASILVDKTTPRGVPDGLRLPDGFKINTTRPLPRPSSGSFFDTIRREYGVDVRRLIRFLPVLLVLSLAIWFFTTPSSTKPQNLEAEYKAKAAQNSRTVIAITNAFDRLEDNVKLTEDSSGLIKSGHVEFSKAALPIVTHRLSTPGSDDFNRGIDIFVETSREVDRAWRSFTAQRLEVISDVMGRLKGFNDVLANPNKSLANLQDDITKFVTQDFQSISTRLEMEGRLLYCQLESNKDAHCPEGSNFVDVYRNLRKDLEGWIPGLTAFSDFKEYRGATARAIKAIEETASTWSRIQNDIKKAQSTYDEMIQTDDLGSIRRSLDKVHDKLHLARENQKGRNTYLHKSFPANILKLARALATYP